MQINDGDTVKTGQVIVKIPRKLGKISDITGGLPTSNRIVLKQRNPSNPAVVR